MALLLPPTPRKSPPRFATTARGIALPCYQLYAVERWVAARDPHPLLLVYTGHPAHTVLLDAHTPQDNAAWDDAVAALRAHGAKPRQTPHGTLMLTSLAHFRSDYTIVHIPSGNYLAALDQLYANISLHRMGCSGRSAVTLEDPSDATKDRFIANYQLPENTVLPNPASVEHLPLPPALGQSTSLTTPASKPNPQLGHGRPSLALTKAQNQSTPSLSTRKTRDKIVLGKTKDHSAFIATVLELVRLIQASLSIFGVYPPEAASVVQHVSFDGLLCDYTVQGIEKWVAHIGMPCVGLENTDRIADPSFVSSLLSLVLATRNRLAYLGYSFILPRDPFLYPHAFALALSAYIQATAPPSVPSNPSALAPPIHHHHQLFANPPHGSVHVSTPLIPLAPPPTSILSAAAASAAAAVAGSATPVGAVLTRGIIDAIASLYEQKARSESRRVRRVLKNKLAPSGGLDSDGAEGSTPDRDRDYSRRHTVNISMSLSGGEEPAANASTGAPGASGKSQQLLSGIASGLRGGTAALANVGVNVGGGSSAGGASGESAHGGDPGALLAPTADLGAFVRSVTDGTGASSTSGKGHRKNRESADFRLGGGTATAAAAAASAAIGIGYPYTHLHEKDVVGASVRALWSGRVVDLARMREEMEAQQESGVPGFGVGADARAKEEREREKEKRRRRREMSSSGVVSDGDDSYGGMGAARSYDGRSTEEESDLTSHGGGAQSFGGMWSGRVRGKLGNWTGLGRKRHHSVDLGHTSPSISSRHGKDKEKEASPQPPPSHSESQALAPAASQTSSTLQVEQPQQLQQQGPPQPSRLLTGSILNRRTSAMSRSGTASRAQSPTLPPMVFSTDIDRDVDDDDLLSSGQVSPLSDYRPNPFNMPLHRQDAHDPSASVASSSTNLAALGTLLGAAQKRPWGRRLVQSARVASWADPISARSGGEDGEEDDAGSGPGSKLREDEADEGERRRVRSIGSDEDGEEDSDVSRLGAGMPRTAPRWKRREKARFHSLLSVVDGAGVRAEELLESSEYEDDDEYVDHRDGYLTEDEDGVLHKRKSVGVNLRRRRSFHDLDTYRGIEVLSPDYMAMDVEICGELLTMRRREEHLRNVFACVRILSASLSQTNTSLRAHYESHTDAIAAIERRASVLAELDTEHVRADKIFQATNTLRYESEQFRADDLWQAARPPRRTVFALRDKVLGMGGRRLRTGVHGAYGPYNRVQWALDGQARLVDHLGRTESEAEEERILEQLGVYLDRPAEAAEEAEEEEGDVVEHPGIKPMWLLRFFTSWGARWSAVAGATPSIPTALPIATEEEKDKSLPTVPASAPVDNVPLREKLSRSNTTG